MAEKRTTEAGIRAIVEQLKDGRLPVNQITLSDSDQAGLRILIRRNGNVTYHAQYEFGGRRPYIKIGHFEEMKLSTARDVVKTIRALVDKGIDPFDQLQEQRVQELINEGPAWRPKTDKVAAKK